MLPKEILQKVQKIIFKGRFLANDIFSGEYESAFRGLGMEFEEVREYQPGDDIRAIDWNVSARMDKPYVKVFREEREQTMILLVDASKSLNFGSQTNSKKEYISEIAAVLAFAAINSNDKVGLLIFTDKVEKFIPPKKGRSHVWHVVSEILSFQPKGHGTNFSVAFEYMNNVIHRKSICFVLSDFFDLNAASSIQRASYRHDIIAIMLNDILEKSLPAGAITTFCDLETGKLTDVDLSSATNRRLYAKMQQTRIDTLSDQLSKYGVDFLDLPLNQTYIDKLLKYFRYREKRM